MSGWTPDTLAFMTLELWYTALLIAMLAAAGVFAVYVVYRLLKD